MAEGRAEIHYPIVLDNERPRITADAFVPLYLGADFELALLAASPEVAGEYLISRRLGEDDSVPHLDSSGVTARPVYVEVGRLRVNLAAARNLAAVTLSMLISSGLATRGDFDEMVAKAEEAWKKRATSSVVDPSISDENRK